MTPDLQPDMPEFPSLDWCHAIEAVALKDPAVPEAAENVAIGKRVEVCFLDLDDTMALPQFRLSED